MKSAVITGATGAIGIALIKKLMKEKVRVLVLCHSTSKRKNYIPSDPLIECIECDLDELNKLDVSYFPKYEVFYHLAWNGTTGNIRNDMHLQIENIENTIGAVELAERLGCHTFIGAGSQAEYGRSKEKLDAETKVNPENGYGMAKLCAGQMSRAVCEQKGIKHIWFRVLSVYGPYDGAGTLIMSVISKLHKNEVPLLTGGEQQWDYIYSDDAANALYLAAISGKNGSVYCLGSGQTRQLCEYIQIISDMIPSKVSIAFGAIPYSPKQVMYLCADITQLSKDTGFEPQISFEDGIKKTINWYRETWRDK